MIAKPSIPEESCQHGQGARCESLIDERLLSFERFDRGATWHRILAGSQIGNLRIEFADRSQAFGLSAVPAVEGLAKNELSARRVVTKIKPICDVARFSAHASLDYGARGPRVHTPDQEIRIPIMVQPKRCLIEARRMGIPFGSPEQVDAVDENGRLVLAHIGPGEGLPDAIGFGNHIAIHERDLKAIRMPPRPHRLVKIRQPHHDGATGAAGADYQNSHCPATEETGREKMLDAHRPLPPLNELRERLWQANQRIGRKPASLVGKVAPQSIVAALVTRDSSHIGVRERAFVESLLPGSD